jgi:hypothetical protein
MMKWSIWVILEGLQGFLFTSSSFFNRLFRFLTIRLPVCNTGLSWRAINDRHGFVARMVAVSVSAPQCVPKVFDTSSMEQFKLTALATSPDRYED